MKKLVLLFSLLNFFLIINNINAQPLSGMYTIDPYGQGPGNYTSFNNAILALQQYGVAGPVIFQVSPYNFNEQITFTSITGTSSTNDITFIGSGINSTILSYAPTSAAGNFTLKFDTSGFITFKMMSIVSNGATYGSVINFSGPNNEITIDSCSIQTSTTATSTSFRLIYSTNAAYSGNINITNNEMTGGESAIYMEGSSGADIMTLYVRDNRISDFYTYGFYGDYISDCSVISNYFETRSNIGSNATSVFFSNISGASSITRNQIVMVNSGFNYGIRMNSCVASSSNYGIVANNFVACITSSTGSQYGISTNGASYYKFLNNSVNLDGGGSGAAALYHQSGSGADFINNIFVNQGPGYAFYTYTPTAVLQASNNCLYTGGTYLASWNSSQTDLAALQAASGKFANSYEYLPNFKTQTDLHINSLKLDGKGLPLTNITDDFDGEPRNASTPDIGADEFTLVPMDIGVTAFDFPTGSVSPGSYDIKVSLSNFDTTDLKKATILFQVNNNAVDTFFWTGTISQGGKLSNIIISYKNFPAGVYHLKAWSEHPNETYDNTPYNDTANIIFYSCSPMSGTYTIGGTGADFSTFNEAVNMLTNCGISSAVVFNINSGVYNEQVILTKVAGASSTNTISFQSASGNPDDVVLQYLPSAQQDATLGLEDSASYFIIKNISIKGLSYGVAVEIDEGSEYNKLTFDKLSVETNGFFVLLTECGHTIVNNCEVSNGKYGIVIPNPLDNRPASIEISENFIHNFKNMGLYAEYCDSLSVTDNKIFSNSDTLVGISLYKQHDLQDVSGNDIQIHGTSNCFGLVLDSCTSGEIYMEYLAPPGSAGAFNLPYDINFIYNNMISITGGSGSLGINIFKSDSVQLFYNTVNLSGTGSSSKCLYSYGGTKHYYLNNIFTNQGSGYAVYFGTNFQVYDFRYSCLKSNGILGYWNGNRYNLSELDSASGKFSNCISEFPTYMGADNLHLLTGLSQAAIPINYFPLDFDQDARDAFSPDMGADEFNKLTNDGALTHLNTTLPCAGTQTLSVYLRNDGAANITTAEIKCKYIGPSGADSMIYQFNGNIAPDDSAYIIIDSTFQTIGGPGNYYDYFAGIATINGILDSNKTNDTVVLLNINYTNGPNISFNGVDPSYCENGVADTISAIPAGGTFSGDGIIGNTFNPSLIQAVPTTTPISYTVTGTNGCSGTDTIWVEVRSLPIVNIITPLKSVYCNYEQAVNLHGSPSGGSFMVNNSNANFFDPSNAPIGTNEIIYTYSDNYNCTASDTIYTTVADQPTVSLPLQSNICSDTTVVNITGANPTGGIYMGPGVSPNSGLFYPIIAGTGLHTISYSYADTNGCSDTAYSTIRVIPTPNANFSAPQSACLDDTITVDYIGQAGPTATFTYFFDNANVISGGMGGPYQLRWQNSGLKQLSLSVTDSGCTSPTNYQFVSIYSTPAIIFSPGPTNICYGDSITLYANQGSGYTYQWYDSSGILVSDTFPQLVVHQSGVYSCMVGSPNGCPAMSNIITITIEPQITSDFSMPLQSCMNDTVQIFYNGTAPTSSVYSWSFDSGNIISGTGSGPYELQWSSSGLKQVSLTVSANGCSSTTTMQNIDIINTPAIISNAGSSTLCFGDSTTLFANTGNGYMYQWYKDSVALSGDTLSQLLVKQSGTYTCMVSTPQACPAMSNAITITIQPQITSDFSMPLQSCMNDTVQIFYNGTAPTSSVYNWYFDEGNIISGSGSGPYELRWNSPGLKQVSLTVSANGCSSTTTLHNINIISTPAIISNAGPSTLCFGDSTTLYANLGSSYSYQWYKDGNVLANDTLSQLIVNQSGVYRCMVSSQLGCPTLSNADTINVRQQITAGFNLASQACINDTVQINFTGSASAAATYNWYFGGGNVLSGSGSGPYDLQWNTSGLKQVSLTVIDSGCTSPTNIQSINIFSSPAIIYNGGGSNICYGDSTTLFANTGTGYMYQWYKDSVALANDTLSQLVVKQSGSYRCMVSTPQGCPAMSNAVIINILPQIIADFSLPAQSCLGDTVLITFTGNAPPASVYNWNFDGGSVISGSNQGPYNVIWNTSNMHYPSLQISNGSCLSNSVQHGIQINSVSPSVTALGSTSFCDGGSVILMGGSGPYTYQWFKNSQQITGANQAFYTATQSGNFQLMVQDTTLGCGGLSQGITVTSNTTNFSLAFTANPTNFTSGPFTSNFTNQTPNKTSYYWNWNFGDGNSSSVIDPNHTYAYDGQYTVKLVAQDIITGCLDTLTKTNYISCTGGTNNPCNITANITPAGYTTICEGDSITLTATAGTNYSYQWYRNNVLIPNSDSLVFIASLPGTYHVLISDSACSATSPPFLLSNYPNIKPVIFGTGSLQPCTNDSMMLSVNVSYASYHWNTGDSTTNIYVNQTGYYQVSVIDNYGCTLTSAPYAVSNSFLNAPSICIVSVDTNDHNVVVWERQNGSLIDSFYIYREGLYAGLYDKIGAVSFNQTSIFVDTNSNPAVRSYRYRLAAVDTCGGVTLMGDYHKTMHLTINAGLNGAWNLIWEGYSGFNYSSYRIYRGTAGGNLSMIAQLPGSSTSFTDMYPPSGTLEYQVEVLSPYDCYPDSIYTKATTNYHTSRSNRVNNTGIPPQYLTANFSANTQSGQWPVQVSFTDLSSGSPTSWLWNFGDGNTSIEQNPKHTYNNTGLYTVSLKVCHDDVCDTTVRTNFIEVLPNGIVELKADISAEVYPNPNKGRFSLHIVSASNEKLQLQIYSTIGKMIHSEELHVSGDVSKDIDLTHMSKGIYYLRLLSKDNMVLSKKIIIQ